MKVRKYLLLSMLVVLLGTTAGCHYGSHDDRRGYGYGRSGSYREGYRDGRAAERRDENSRDRYYDRDYWRRRS
jgi:hypothetical protein